uniref:Uncharacterized protein n=1 Tax=Arundo donax TaxID=35708 RepID=A0A0A9A2E6_ARUDO
MTKTVVGEAAMTTVLATSTSSIGKAMAEAVLVLQKAIAVACQKENLEDDGSRLMLRAK